MTLFISHNSALAYWRSNARRGKQNRYLQNLPSSYLGKGVLDPDNLARLGFGSAPFHISVRERGHRSDSPNIVSHVYSGPLLPGMYEQVAADLYVSTPEYLFMQMAAAMSLQESVKLGFELCASFRLNEFYEGGFEKCEPLTASRQLKQFCTKAHNLYGREKALTALQYVQDGAASPMEVAVAELLTLPRRYGGYGLPPCSMNYPVHLQKQETVFFGDLVWPTQRVIAEYDSDAFHLSSRRAASDSARRNALQDAGWHVITVTRQMATHTEAFDLCASQLAKALGVRLPKPTGSQQQNRVQLRALLLPTVRRDEAQ